MFKRSYLYKLYPDFFLPYKHELILKNALIIEITSRFFHG